MAFVVDRVDDLDREAIRQAVIERFSATRMTDGYEAVYRRMLGGSAAGHDDASSGMGSADRERIALRRVDRLEAMAGGR
jgi:hypothetical protein